MAGGRLSVKMAVADVATALPTISCHVRARAGELVANRAAARSLGDDRLQLRRLGGRLDHHLAADREADAADPLRIDVRAALQERDRGVDVALALPAEEVGVALALALTATVEEQDAVAVPCQQLRALLRRMPVRGTRSPRRRCATGCTSR